MIDANSSQMGQLFQNLISNSLKFKKKDSNPALEITTGEIDGSQLSLKKDLSSYKSFRWNGGHYWKKEKFCKISFKDNGIGFDRAYADRIFEVFQRLNNKDEYEGTGIGLAICKRIIEHHHGIITTDSERGQGATFNIFLPFSQVDYEVNLRI